MADSTPHRLDLLPVLLMAAFLGAAVPRAVRAADLPAPAQPSRSFKGTETCVRCHRTEQGDWTGPATAPLWRHDAHSRAHLALASTNPRTAAIEARLGIEASRTRACIACHSRPPEEPAPSEASPLLHAGISCETCHGAASAYLEPHTAKDWRFLPPEEKAAFGMADLRSPAVKGANCAACHVGDLATGRLVTHAMFAAGHPPLRAFEVESFSAALGPHWRRLDDKPGKVRAEAAAAGYATESAGPVERSLVEGLLVLRHSVALAADLAAASDAAVAGADWPELAVHDCQSCHHDLVVPSPRQALGYAGHVPGRPTLPRWPMGLADAGLRSLDDPTSTHDLLAPLLDAFDPLPFGSARRVAVAAREPLSRIDAAVERLSARAPQGTAADRARLDLLAAVGREADDVDAARVVAEVLIRGLPAGEREAAVAETLSRLLGLEPGAAHPGEHRPPPTSSPDIRAVRDAFTLP